ncbi:hypothetical protein F2Q68_00031649 [Brassica cretica]|uniref:Uncharacterized protein n=1 Tax=Brassica cretica TaxID=69181 RepID=A0A8S9GAR3_BRACR|nr:hypothetical protein F2Q68_00031649 [Brassica cretica]
MLTPHFESPPPPILLHSPTDPPFLPLLPLPKAETGKARLGYHLPPLLQLVVLS